MSRELCEFKFVVQPVLTIVEDGVIVGEQSADPLILYGLKQISEFIERFPNELKELNEQAKRSG